MSKKEYNELKEQDGQEGALEERIIEALGGGDNITHITCCATRLRVTLKDAALMASDEAWKQHLEAMGVVHMKDSVQIIYGVRVQNITTRIKDILKLD